MGGSIEKDVKDLKERRSNQSAFTSKGTRRRRTRTTSDQLAMLEESFARDNMPDKEERLRLVEAVGMTYKQIVVWFQNRRAKERSDERKLYFSARQRDTQPSTTNKNSSPYAPQTTPIVPDSTVTGHSQSYPVAMAASNLVQMGVTAASSRTSFSREPVGIQAAPTGYQNSMQAQAHSHLNFGDRSLGSPQLQSSGTTGIAPIPPSTPVVLPPPTTNSGMGVGSDLLRFSLSSGHFQSHIPLKAPTPPLEAWQHRQIAR